MTTGMSTAGATNLEEWLAALSVEELKQVAINSLTFTKITVREYPVEYIRARVLRKIATWPIGSLRRLGYFPLTSRRQLTQVSTSEGMVKSMTHDVSVSTPTEISNSDDVLDVRDVIARVEELEGDPTLNDMGECDGCGVFLKRGDEDHGPECRVLELQRLNALLEELAGNGGEEDWRGDWYPLLLVRDSHFRDFAQQEAEELDLVKSDARWPYTCIDWEQAAEQLKQDYSTVEFDGITYWYR